MLLNSNIDFNYKLMKDNFDKFGIVSYKVRRDFHECTKLLGEKFYKNFNTILFSLCANKTLYIWNKYSNTCDLFPTHNVILEEIKNNSQKIINKNKLLFLKSKIDDLCFYNGEEFINKISPSYFSCVRAMEAFLDEFEFNQVALTDIEAEISEWDSAFFSSCAVAGGAEWQKNEIEINYKEMSKFWYWYIYDAIPIVINDTNNLNNK